MKNNLIRKLAVLFGGVAFSATLVFADNDVVTVEGIATYYGETNDSPADCKRKALAQARIEALRSFGTIVSHNLFQSESDNGESAESSFLALSESEVKGEWLGDVGEPDYQTSFSDDDTLVVTCRIKGRARALSNEAAEFESVVLRNGTDRRNADTHFNDGDDMYVSFSAPVNGYVMIFLLDEAGDAYCLLPYLRSTEDMVKVKKNYDYVFFDSSRAGTEFGSVDDLVMTSDRKKEYNKLYVLFSPNPIAMPMVRPKRDGLPASMKTEDFHKWIIKVRRNDPRLGVQSTPITISPSTSATEKIRR